MLGKGSEAAAQKVANDLLPKGQVGGWGIREVFLEEELYRLDLKGW